MCRTRSEQFKEERILSVMFDRDLGLCIELGDEKIDDDGIYGYAPTQGFIKALKKEIVLEVKVEKEKTVSSVKYRLNAGLYEDI